MDEVFFFARRKRAKKSRASISVMGWPGRAPAPRASEAGKGRRRQGARRVSDNTQYRDRRDRHRYRQELVPRRGPRCARRHRAAAKVVAWASGSAARQYTGLPDRDGSLRRRTSPEPQTRIAWPRCRVDAGQICPPYSKGQKNDFNDAEAIAEAVQRPTMKFVATKTGSAGVAPGARAAGVLERTGIINQIRAFMLETRDRCAPGHRLPAHGAAHYPCNAHRCPVATHVACRRGVGSRLAPAGSAHRWPVRRDRGTGPPRSGVFAPDDGAWHRTDHFERHGGRDRHWRVFSKGRDFGAWLGLVPKQISTGDRTILGKSRGAAIATCAFCSCRRHGLCWSG